MANAVDNHIAAEPRDSFGKGAARKIRALGKIPAVIYGHGTEPKHIILPAHETGLLLRKANALLEIAIEGKTELALVKDVQKDPVRQIIEHIDLILVVKGEKITVEIPVHVEGEPFGTARAELDHPTLSIEADATKLPERVVVSVEGLEAGTHILAGEIELPEGSTLITEPDTLIVGIVAQAAAEEEEAPAEAPAAE